MATTEPAYGLITTTEDLERLCARVLSDAQAGRPFGFDIETSYEGEDRESASLHPEENFICGISLTSALTWARYIPVCHAGGTNLPESRVAELLWPILATAMGVAHGAKFELRCMRRWFLEHLGSHPLYGEAVRGARGYFPVLSCTLLESYAEGRNRSHGLKEITLSGFGHAMTELLELFPAGLTQRQRKSIRFAVLDQHDPKVYRYACEDALWALANHLRRYPALVSGEQRWIYQTEMAVLPVVAAMEDEGVSYDWLLMRDARLRAAVFRDKLQAQIMTELTLLVRQARGPEVPAVSINLGSPAQISRVLYEDLGMPQRRRSRKTGKPSTDKVALKGLSQTYPVVRHILDWKSLTKLIGTYLDKYESAYSYAADGRTHPSHIQHGVPAGRFAVADPPYQQTPKVYHYELASGEVFDFNFRDAIRAPEGWYLLGFDYSQIELRVIAGEAQETALLDAFASGVDVHSLTASLMLGKPLEYVTKADRALGKTLNFALVYQMGVDGLADRLGITRDAAEDLFAQYFTAYPRIKSWTDRTVARAKSLGCVGTRFGRRVPVWEFESSETYIYREGERLAGNAPVQGGAADYMKVAMARAHSALAGAGYLERVRLVMNIHDALEFYVREDVPLPDVIKVLQPAVVFPVEGWPPMVAEWHAGRRWGSVVELAFDGETVRMKEKDEPAPVPADPDEEGPALPALDLGEVSGFSPGGSELPASAGPADGAHDGGGDPGAGGAVGSGAGPARRGDRLPGAPRTVVITVTELPEAMALARLQVVLTARPGSSPVVLHTPEADIPLGEFGITPAAQPAVSAALGGAMVAYDLDADDWAALADGLA